MADYTNTGANPYGTGSVSAANTPNWLAQGNQQIAGMGAELLTQPYVGYEGPRVAGPSGMQTQYYDALTKAYGSASQPREYMTPNFGAAPDIGSMGGLAQYSYDLAALGERYADPDAVRAYGYDPESWLDHSSEYLNPYTDQVVDEVARLGNQNLMESVIPNLNSTFVGAGQFGSSRNADFMNRALRENQATISGKQGELLRSGWNDAYGQFAGDQQRALAGAQYGRDTELAAQGLYNDVISGNNADIFKANEFDLNATRYGNADWLQKYGQDTSRANALTSAQAQQASIDAQRRAAELQFQLGLLGRMDTAGKQQQDLEQTSLDTAYGAFLEQRNYPYKQLTDYNALLGGMNQTYGRGTTSGSSYITPGTTGANRVLGGLGAIGEILNSGGYF